MNTVRPQKRLRAGLFGTCAFVVTVLCAGLPGAAQQPQPAVDNEYQVGAILWTQSSGEIRALYYQAFALARMTLEQDLKKNKSKQKRAVVVDIDETVLDNSPQQARLVKEHKAFTQADWAAWVNAAEAQPLPGAVEFLRYAEQKGVRVFYISNRAETERAGTLANLRKFNFPGVSDETVLLRTGAPSKEPRRKQVATQYRIVLLAGDNLNDFADFFEQSTTVGARVAAVEAHRAEFGTRFIMLPNAMYGDWENAVYSNLAPGETRGARRHNALKAFTPPQP